MASTVTVDFNANLARFTSAIDKATNDLSKFQKNSDRISRNIGNTFKTIGSGFAVGAAFKQIADISDSYTKLTAQLKNSTNSFAEFGQSFENVQRIASSAQVDINALATTYARLSNALRDFGASQSNIADVAETITLALKVNGATAEETASATLQLSQAFGKGKLDGDEFRAAMESAPNLMRILAESMKVPVGALKDMAKNGEITSDVLLKAFSDQKVLDGLREQAKLTRTISGAYTEIYNQIKLTVGETEKATGATSLYAKTLSGVAALIEKIRSGGGIDSGFLSLIPGGQAFGVFNQAGRFAGKNNPSASGTIKRQAASSNDPSVQTFEELTKGLRLTSVELEKIKIREDEAKKSFDAGKITLAQYNEIVKALGKERKALNKSSGSTSKQSIDADIEAAKRFVASLTEEASTLGLTGTALKQYEAAHLKLTPAQRAVVADALKKIETFEEEKTRLEKLTEAYENHQRVMDDFNDRETQGFEEQGAFDAETVKSLSDFVDQLERAKDPSIELLDNIGKIQSAVSMGIISVEQGDEYAKYLEDAAKKTKETTDDITLFWKKAAENMQDAMSDFFFDVMQGNLSDLASSFKSTIDRMVANMLAARAATSLFGEEFTSGKSDVIGGVAGNIFGSIGGFFGDLLPSFAVGTPYVPHDMVANIHKGERILTADENRKFSSGQMGGGGNVYMTINTPDANSFRKSLPQTMAEAQRGLNRGRRVT